MNSDGSGLTVLQITTRRISPVTQPTWTSDGERLLFSNSYNLQLVSIDRDGFIARYDCALLRAAPVPQPQQAIMSMGYDESRYQIALFDLGLDQVLHSFAVESDDHLSIGTNALVGSNLVYQRCHRLAADAESISCELVVQDVDTGDAVVILQQSGRWAESGIGTPAISPDGQWISYTANDGLYLVHPDGTNRTQILPVQIVRDYAGGSGWGQWPPVPSWSPDSKWLVYHRCILPGIQECSPRVENYAIYKLNIETREEVLLVEGGLNPYWRLALSELEQ